MPLLTASIDWQCSGCEADIPVDNLHFGECSAVDRFRQAGKDVDDRLCLDCHAAFCKSELDHQAAEKHRERVNG